MRLVLNELCKEDEGAYKCKAENQEGVASTTGYLSVTGTGKCNTRKQIYVALPISCSVCLGVFNCQVTSLVDCNYTVESQHAKAETTEKNELF